MTWNYRLMKRQYQDDQSKDIITEYGIYEVYYNENGEVSGWLDRESRFPGRGICGRIEKYLGKDGDEGF